ncbi:MAG: putative F420-0 ABC transporter substrate-binding protein [Bifidobacteriaceae bacterium]|nr:putative F420-0 ABC transporter substrate-binding protein [Bifidobacteriaceae bacterium]
MDAKVPRFDARVRRAVGRVHAGLAALAVVAAGACASPPPADSAPTSAPTNAAAPTPAYPLTVDNCGHEVTVDAPPQRIVAVKSATVELLIALGLGERIAGSAYLDGPLPEWLADQPGAAAAVAQPLAEKVPSLEAVVGLEPDFVFAGWESTLTATGIAERERLESLGIGTYVAPAACRAEGYEPSPLTFEHIFDAITEAGDVFGAPDAAARLVADQRSALASIAPTGGGNTALWWSSATDTPYVGAGAGAPQLIMDAAGLANIAAGEPGSWTSYSWEAVAAADPAVLVLVDSTWNSAAHKIEFLEGSPLTRDLAAVKAKRYVTVPFAATEAGVRTVQAAQDLAQQLSALDLP